MPLSLDDFDYDLPAELIAQVPASRREESRLMVLDRAAGRIREACFAELAGYLAPGSLLVLNDTRVVPARLWGRRESGGRVEVVLLEPPPPEAGPGTYETLCLTRPSRRLRPGTRLVFGPDLTAEVAENKGGGRTRLRFFFSGPPRATLEAQGQMPLPPYIRRTPGRGPEDDLDRERYQTVYARAPGAVAAPTAGLHFTPGLLEDLQARGFEIAALTLHVSYGTFAPVRVRDITRHRVEAERLYLPAATAEAVNQARAQGRKVTAVGTTVVRGLEFAGREGGLVQPDEGWCDLFIYPGFEFKVVDHLLTNFHLPRSSLLMLVAALAGREFVLQAYRRAVAARFRFYSYGDAMLIC